MLKNNPVLTDRQQSKTLSAKIKKKPPKSTLKSVLAQPIEHFWPEISENETKELITRLHEIATQTSVPPSGFLKSSKSIKVGLNESLRNLKTGKVDVLLISGDIRPKFIVEQVIQLALAHNARTKVVCALELTTNIAQTFSLSACICLSFSSIQTDANFVEFYAAISRMASQHQIPTHLSEVPGKLNKSVVIPVKMDIEEYIKAPTERAVVPPLDLNRLYLTKPVISSERCFVPVGTAKATTLPSDNWSDFISLSDTATNARRAVGDTSVKPQTYHLMQAMVNAKASGSKKKKHRHFDSKSAQHPYSKTSKESFKYIPLSVHKIQGNPNKVKTTARNMKKKIKKQNK